VTLSNSCVMWVTHPTLPYYSMWVFLHCLKFKSASMSKNCVSSVKRSLKSLTKACINPATFWGFFTTSTWKRDLWFCLRWRQNVVYVMFRICLKYVYDKMLRYCWRYYIHGVYIFHNLPIPSVGGKNALYMKSKFHSSSISVQKQGKTPVKMIILRLRRGN